MFCKFLINKSNAYYINSHFTHNQHFIILLLFTSLLCFSSLFESWFTLSSSYSLNQHSFFSPLDTIIFLPLKSTNSISQQRNNIIRHGKMYILTCRLIRIKIAHALHQEPKAQKPHYTLSNYPTKKPTP